MSFFLGAYARPPLVDFEPSKRLLAAGPPEPKDYVRPVRTEPRTSPTWEAVLYFRWLGEAR